MVAKNIAQTTGKRGEDLAVNFLLETGYQIVTRNFRTPLGELDIIALKDNQTVLVEVKTRTSPSFGLPEEAITQKKLNKIKRTGEIWLSQHPTAPQSLRIDLIAILDLKIKHYKNIGDFS